MAQSMESHVGEGGEEKYGPWMIVNWKFKRAEKLEQKQRAISKDSRAAALQAKTSIQKHD